MGRTPQTYSLRVSLGGWHGVPLSHFSTYFFSDDDTHRMFDPRGTDDPKHWRDRAHEARMCRRIERSRSEGTNVGSCARL